MLELVLLVLIVNAPVLSWTDLRAALAERLYLMLLTLLPAELITLSEPIVRSALHADAQASFSRSVKLSVPPTSVGLMRI